jgi:hypothetical protein
MMSYKMEIPEGSKLVYLHVRNDGTEKIFRQQPDDLDTIEVLETDGYQYTLSFASLEYRDDGTEIRVSGLPPGTGWRTFKMIELLDVWRRLANREVS